MPRTTKTKVVNIHRQQKYDVYIGRAGKGQSGKWGNPFYVGSREDNIRKYRDWILTQDKLLGDLEELKGKKLGCFCSPLPCHGDVLVELIESGEYC